MQCESIPLQYGCRYFIGLTPDIRLLLFVLFGLLFVLFGLLLLLLLLLYAQRVLGNTLLYQCPFSLQYQSINESIQQAALMY
jgi:hypothetical protein